MTDVIIAGGGPAGLAAAIALAERGIAVAVADAAGGVSARRGELLPEGASAILERLGLADIANAALFIEDVVSHWGAAKLQSHGDHPGLGLHGWGIDRLALSQAMLRRLQTLGIPVETARITTHEWVSDKWRITLSGPRGRETRFARYLIDATGRPASIARRSGAMLLQGTDLVAAIWHTHDRGPARMLAEAAPRGWWYKIPHPAGSTLGFVTSARQAREVSRAAAGFLSGAGNALTLISIFGASGKPHLMDCRSSVLDKLSGPGWLATGDAAAAFDPIASQGLFNALSGGFFAGQAAADAIAGDEDAPRVLEALSSHTANRTHAMTHLQYAALPFDTAFWRRRSNPAPSKASPSPQLCAASQ